MFTQRGPKRFMVKVIGGEFYPIEDSDRKSPEQELIERSTEATGAIYQQADAWAKEMARSLEPLIDQLQQPKVEPKTDDDCDQPDTSGSEDSEPEEDSIVTRSGIKALNRELSIEDEELAPATTGHFNYPKEIESLRALMMVPNSYLNAYVDRNRVQPKESMIGFKLIAEYHRQATYLSDTYGVSLLVGHVFGVKVGILDRLTEKYQADVLHYAAKRRLGLVASRGTTTLPTPTYAEILTIADGIPAVVPEKISDPVEPAAAEVIETAVTETLVKEDEVTVSDRDKAVFAYMKNSDKMLTKEAAEIFKYPFEVEYLGQKCAYWNATFLNAYARYKTNGTPIKELDPVLAADIEELEMLHARAKQAAPVSLFADVIWDVVGSDTMAEIVKAAKLTPEQLNEAVLLSIGMITVKDLTVITAAEAADFEKRLLEVSNRLQGNEPTEAVQIMTEKMQTEPIDTAALAKEIDTCLNPAGKPGQTNGGKRKNKKKKR